MKTNAYKYALRFFMAIYVFLLRMFKHIGLRKNKCRKGGDIILITGTFYSDNWLATHLRPLANSKQCQKVYMVATTTIPSMDNVEAIYPPKLLVLTIGAVQARLVVFIWQAIKIKPDILAGFHLLLNGLVAVLLSKLLGVRSLYICGGGPREVDGGGYRTESRLFNKIGHYDSYIEKQLISAVSAFDYVITMGSGAIQYFKNKGVETNYHIVPGGFLEDSFYPTDVSASIDLILIGRISEVKRVDRFIDAVSLLSKNMPNISAVVVGDGPLRDTMERYSVQKGVSENIEFVGWQDDIGHFLRKAKVFVLTSDSEGLSQALIQAMLCGLPAVVSKVGDLGDLVHHGVNGFLVSDLCPEVFCQSFSELLTTPGLLESSSVSALRSAEKYKVNNVSRVWDVILGSDQL